jgi:UDPglucose 6-dehydrogenase
MSLESAEMTKHALNAFLATSVTFANEVARLCERVGADAREVERGLKTEARIGLRAYLSPGSAFAGGTLARDVRFLREFGQDRRVETPVFDGVLRSNDVHKGWMRDKLDEALAGVDTPVVAMLGLTYKPGTSTLRRSHAIELCEWLGERGVEVRAHDPAVTALPDGTAPKTRLCADPRDALRGADVAVLATGWPEFQALSGNDVASLMRRPQVIDQNWFLASSLERDERIAYHAVGRGAR